jgi:hypothetical protein
MHPTDEGSRRRLLQGTAFLGAVAVVRLFGGSSASAAKLAKADVKYQDRPNDGKDCDDCIQFIPDPRKKADGTCKVVDGSVSAHGYCLAFTPKPVGR